MSKSDNSENKQHFREAAKADELLFNGNGYLVGQYLGILKSLRELLCNLDENKPGEFIFEVIMLYYSHSYRPMNTGEYPIPFILLPNIQMDGLFNKANYIQKYFDQK